MAITVADLIIRQSQRMTDFADGGGRMSGVEVISGTENMIFDDVSDVDRAAGDLSIRKCYGAVVSGDTDKLLDAGFVVWEAPVDPAASVLVFTTGDFYDERTALVAKLEGSITRGGRLNGWLYGPHLTGQRAVLVWQRPGAEIPATGGRLELVARSGGIELYSQFVWITRVTSELRTFYESVGGGVIEYPIQILTLEVAEPLRNGFAGIEPSRADPVISSNLSLIYETRYNADAVALTGRAALAESANIDDFTVKIPLLFAPLVPTVLQETAIPDATPGGDSAVLVAGNTSVVSFDTALAVIKPNASLWFGSAVYPGSVSINVSGAAITDQGGTLLLGGTPIGTMDYSNGVGRWTTACPDYGLSAKSITFKPATALTRVANTAALYVTPENRGFVWVTTLAPIPAPKSLRISYRAVGQWYTLTDRGDGVLTGADTSYGVASISLTTGTVTLTTGALPDVDSEIIFAWTIATDLTVRGGTPVDAPVVRGQTEHAGVARNTFSVSWPTGNSVSDDGAGNLTGTGGSGQIRYAAGEWWVRPDVLPAVGTVFTVDYDYGNLIVETFVNPAVVSNSISLALANTNIAPNTLEIEWPGYPMVYVANISDANLPAVIDRDNGSGGFVATAGSVNYAAGTLTFTAQSSLTAMARSQSVASVGQWQGV